MTQKVCETCDGEKYCSEPSDGYENAKRWRCPHCRGTGRYDIYALSVLPEMEKYLADLISTFETLPKKISEISDLVKELKRAVKEGKEE